jgi:hypothetical protein
VAQPPQATLAVRGQVTRVATGAWSEAIPGRDPLHMSEATVRIPQHNKRLLHSRLIVRKPLTSRGQL